MMRLSGAAVLLAFGMLLPAASHAQELKVGVSAEPTSIDPHFHNLGPNNALRREIFEGLVATDANQKIVPSLAESWKTTDSNTWVFKLRPDVKFSNGTPFTATDVIYTFCRVPTVKNSPSSFTVYTRGISDIQTPDAHTVVIKTEKPIALLPNNLSTIGIISAKLYGGENVKYKPTGCENMGTPPQSADFNDPAKAIGTGPFKLVEYIRGNHIKIARNDSYWGKKPYWKDVLIRPITSEGARVAALLAGDVDLIETPPIQDFKRIKSSGFKIVQGLSNRVIYIALDQFSDKTPGVKGTDKNPFKDKRVREALSMAFDRNTIDSKIMGGLGVPAGELLPVPLFGTSPDRQPMAYNPDAARKMLAAAGYPNGFEVVLGTPNDRYINDSKIAQAIAQYWTRIGVKTTVDAMTKSTFFKRRNKYEFSAYLAGWGADSGEMSNPLMALVVTPDSKTGGGSTNRGRYSNKQVDDLVYQALETVNDEKREALLQKASKIAMEDDALLPIHFEVTPWAFKKTLNYTPRVDQYTLYSEVTPAK